VGDQSVHPDIVAALVGIGVHVTAGQALEVDLLAQSYRGDRRFRRHPAFMAVQSGDETAVVPSLEPSCPVPTRRVVAPFRRERRVGEREFGDVERPLLDDPLVVHHFALRLDAHVVTDVEVDLHGGSLFDGRTLHRPDAKFTILLPGVERTSRQGLPREFL
jgi:hypothetical protein